VIGLDDSDLGFGGSYAPSQQSQQSLVLPRVSPDYSHPADDDVVVPTADEIGILSDTSSSDSSDSSGSESEVETQPSNSTITANGRHFCKIFLLLSKIHIMVFEFYVCSSSSSSV
jgi:hypothetical protein